MENAIEATISTGPSEGDVLQEQRETWLAAERESKKRMRVEELPEYIRGIASCISASFIQLKISTLHMCCWGMFQKKLKNKDEK